MSFTKFIFALALAFLGNVVKAQTQFLSDNSCQNRIGLSTGLQPGFNFQTRFDRKYQLPILSKSSSYFINTEATFFRSLKAHSGFSIGSQTLVWQHNKLAATAETALTNARLENKVYQARKWEWYLKGTAGYFGKRAGLQLSGAYHHNLGTKLMPSSYYSQMVYPDAYSGWLLSVGGYLDIELRATFLVAKRLELQSTFTKSYTTTGAPLSVLPFQFGLGAAWRF